MGRAPRKKQRDEPIGGWLADGSAVVAVSERAAARMRELPPTAAAEEEIRWIRAHPAMLRRLPLELTEEDVGSAPSQAAVIQLVHWLTDRGHFYQQLLMEQRKVAPLSDRVIEDEGGIEQQIEEILRSLAEQSGWRVPGEGDEGVK